MTGVVVIVVVLLLLAAAAVWWSWRAGRPTHRRASHGLEVRRGLDSFPVPPPQLADGPVSLHLERPVDDGHGRHRRPDGELPDGMLGMTAIMRKLDAAAVAADARMQAAVDAETGRIPRVKFPAPRPSPARSTGDPTE